MNAVLGWIAGGIITVLLAGLVVYWQLVVAEGAYLGRRIVTLLYDWFAPRYDQVKQFQPAMDIIMLAMPIMTYPGSREPLVLDVATGTGRLPLALLSQRGFRGHIVALDLSGRMLAQAQSKLASHADRVQWLRHDAQVLPFDDDHFDVVTCLEALEFFPQPTEAIREMVRVLKPGGLMMISNRIGPDVWKLPGRTLPTASLVRRLEQFGLQSVEAERWLVDYDLVRAIK